MYPNVLYVGYATVCHVMWRSVFCKIFHVLRCIMAYMPVCWSSLLVHGQVTIIFVVSVCLFVCAEFFSAVFDAISIKLRHMLYVWV